MAEGSIELSTSAFAALLVGQLDQAERDKLMAEAVQAVLRSRDDNYRNGKTVLESIIIRHISEKTNQAVGEWVAANYRQIQEQTSAYLDTHLPELVAQVSTKIFERVLEQAKRGY